MDGFWCLRCLSDRIVLSYMLEWSRTYCKWGRYHLVAKIFTKIAKINTSGRISTHGRRDGRTHEHTDAWTYKQTDGRTDTRTYGWSHTWTDGRLNVQTDRRPHWYTDWLISDSRKSSREGPKLSAHDQSTCLYLDVGNVAVKVPNRLHVSNRLAYIWMSVK